MNMAKEKKALTVKQKYKKQLGIARALKIAEYPTVALPFGILAIVNADTWFVENTSSWKIGIGGTIAVALVVIATILLGKNNTPKKEQEENPNAKMIWFLLGWYAIAFLFLLIAEINMEIYKIMMISGSGIAGALGLNIGSNVMLKKANKTKSAMELAELELEKEQAKKESVVPVD